LPAPGSEILVALLARGRHANLAATSVGGKNPSRKGGLANHTVRIRGNAANCIGRFFNCYVSEGCFPFNWRLLGTERSFVVSVRDDLVGPIRV